MLRIAKDQDVWFPVEIDREQGLGCELRLRILSRRELDVLTSGNGEADALLRATILDWRGVEFADGARPCTPENLDEALEYLWFREQALIAAVRAAREVPRKN